MNSLLYLPRGPNISHSVEQIIIFCYSVCCHENVFRMANGTASLKLSIDMLCYAVKFSDIFLRHFTSFNLVQKTEGACAQDRINAQELCSKVTDPFSE
jgi:hypothetical protein